MKIKYIKVYYPECKVFDYHPRFNECCVAHIQDLDGDFKVLFVPEDLYYEVMG